MPDSAAQETAIKAPVDWVDKISNGELASLSVTIQKVRHVLGDRMSSLNDLTNEIVKDPGLTSKLLKIANSPLYAVTQEPVKTVSRAASFIGFDTIRSICMASRLLDAVTADNAIPDSIRERALARIATSLHAAVQARSMAAKAKDAVREEVFVATLLQSVGECGFWCIDSEEARELDDALAVEADSDALIRDKLGLDFKELSLGLANAWGLGGLLTESLSPNPPAEREYRIIRTANDIAETVAKFGWQSDQVNELLPQAAALLDMTEIEAKRKLVRTGKEAEDLARDYGAGQLAGRMAKKPKVAEETETTVTKGAPANAPDSNVQLKVLRELSAMMTQKPDLNQIIKTAMVGIHKGVGMDRTITALLSQDRNSVSTRIFMGQGGDVWSKKFKFSLTGPANLLQSVVLNTVAQRFSAAEADERTRERAGPLGRFSNYNDFIIAPIEVGSRCIGVVYADRALSQSRITEEDFKSFSHFAMQIGVCITTISARRR